MSKKCTVCSVCGVELTESNKGKHSSKCKSCLTVYYRLRQQWRRKTVPKQIEYDKKYNKEHPEIVKKAQKKYYESHPEHFREKNKKAYARKRYIFGERRRNKYNTDLEYRKKLSNYKKQYYKTHTEQVIKSVTNWQKEHPALTKEYKKHAKPETIEKRKEYAKVWQKSNPDKLKEYGIRYRKNNPDYIESVRNWKKSHPDIVKVHNKANRDKRRREMECYPLNKYFYGSNGHHINNRFVIYIPKQLHLKYSGHNHKKPETMVEINKQAFFYLMNEMIS